MGTIDRYKITLRALSLSSGRPLSNISVAIRDGETKRLLGETRTNAQGMAQLAGHFGKSTHLAVSSGDVGVHRTIAPRLENEENVQIKVLTDRDVYRVGDEANVSVSALRVSSDAVGRVVPVGLGEAVPVVCSISSKADQTGSKSLVSFNVPLTDAGIASKTVHLLSSTGFRPGPWEIACETKMTQDTLVAHGRFTVSDIVHEQISLKVDPSSKQVVVGQRLVVTAALGDSAKGKRSNLRLDYLFEESSGMEGFYVPPGNEAFWFYGYRFEKAPPLVGSKIFDDAGVVRIPFALDRQEWIRARTAFQLTMKIALRNTATDTVSSLLNQELIVHPAAVYVGIRPDERFLPSSDSIKAHAIVVDSNGKAVDGHPVEIRITEHRSFPARNEKPGGEGIAIEIEERGVGSCSRTSKDVPVECSFPPERPGEYWIEASTFDKEGRQSVSGTHLYIHGNPAPPWQDPTSPTALQLVLDRESYDVGDTAQVMVRVTFVNGHGLYALERAGVLEARPLDIDGTISIVSVPIVEDYIGGVDVSFQMLQLGRGKRRSAEGRIRIPVRPHSDAFDFAPYSTITRFCWNGSIEINE